MKFNFIEIDKFNKLHIDLLYELLEKRLFNISHRKMPDYKSHQNFIKNNNYRIWKLIYKNNQFFGSYYVTFDNFIGINLLSSDTKDYKNIIQNILKSEKPLPEIKTVRNKDFLINSSPDNKNLIKALKILKFKHIQTTFLCS